MGQALVKMVNDCDHVVRMHVAKAVTTLYLTTSRSTSETTSCGSMVLLSRAGQERIFQEILRMLQLAFIVSDGLEELSAEDESVNRVASHIYTLLLSGCVSPVCESKVVGELVMAVGRGHTDADLVTKVTTLTNNTCVLC